MRKRLNTKRFWILSINTYKRLIRACHLYNHKNKQKHRSDFLTKTLLQNRPLNSYDFCADDTICFIIKILEKMFLSQHDSYTHYENRTAGQVSAIQINRNHKKYLKLFCPTVWKPSIRWLTNKRWKYIIKMIYRTEGSIELWAISLSSSSISEGNIRSLSHVE